MTPNTRPWSNGNARPDGRGAVDSRTPVSLRSATPRLRDPQVGYARRVRGANHQRPRSLAAITSFGPCVARPDPVWSAVIGARVARIWHARVACYRWPMAGARVLRWNGQDLPDELRELPAGTYVVEAVDAPLLTPEEDEGLERALASLRAGKGRSLDQVRQSIASVLDR
ncbi:MAG: hypothetical protein HS111_28275 [Kofleriaceae bacterium]|nr:hypothetical protein [Kofleriaceae bacterium]